MTITCIDRTNMTAFERLMPDADYKNIKTNPDCFALGMIDDEQGDIAIAAICGVIDADSFKINSLFVMDEYRRQGIAENLIYALISKCADAEIYYIYCDFPYDDMPELYEFFKAMDFSEEPLAACRGDITIGTAKTLKNLQMDKVSSEQNKVMSFSKISPSIIKAFAGRMYKNGTVYLGDYLAEKAVDMELSLAYMNGDDIDAMLVADKAEDEIVIRWAFADSKNPALLLVTLREFFKRLAEKYPDDTIVTTAAVTELSSKLMHAITGGKAEIVEKWIRMGMYI
ncbi:MAG: GNAT family N-acetyltransferase [Lachnospiraceae bacterium]|nr:GNAT family N-acetyltransferase [Lachnospiraceae bacterium]